jgi:hypothetical protein
VGSYNGGLNRFNPLTEIFINYQHNPNDLNTLGSNQVHSIHIDYNSVCWVGTFGGGLNRFNVAGEFEEASLNIKRYTHNPSDPYSISDDRVYIVHEDKFGDLWIGTYGGGLNKFNKQTEKFKYYKNIPGDENSISDNKVISIYDDEIGNLWIGTFGGGLNKFNRSTEKFEQITGKEEFNGDTAYGVLEDDNNNLWISSDDGIFAYNTGTNSFTFYDLTDGLQSMEFSGGAYSKSGDGEMFFGGINGLNYFYPDDISFNLYVPPIVISSFRIFDQQQKGELEEITLEFDENFFSFEFAALDYTNSRDNLYAYKLENLENDWHYTNADLRIANYTNLSPGSYTFRVKGSNNDGVWNTEGISVKLTILAPFYQNDWFIISSFLFVAGIIIYVVSSRIKNILAIEKLKAKLAADLHDNIGSGLTEISILSELAFNELNVSKEGASQKLNLISDTSRILIDSMSDIVWIVNPQRDSLYDLIIRLKDSYNEFLSQVGISFKTNDLEAIKNVRLPMDYKQNLLLIFKESINNCIKHSKCSKIYLKAYVKRDLIFVILEDDGVGIEEKNIIYGNGIKNIKERAKSIGGELEWNSVLNHGTSVRFKGKLEKKNIFRFKFKSFNN